MTRGFLKAGRMQSYSSPTENCWQLATRITPALSDGTRLMASPIQPLGPMALPLPRSAVPSLAGSLLLCCSPTENWWPQALRTWTITTDTNSLSCATTPMAVSTQASGPMESLPPPSATTALLHSYSGPTAGWLLEAPHTAERAKRISCLSATTLTAVWTPGSGTAALAPNLSVVLLP
jgi:hypothetical protein